METSVSSTSPAAADAAQREPSTGAALAAAALLIAFGMRRRSVFGTAAGIAGAGLLAATLVPRVAPRVTSSAARRRAVDINTEFVVHRGRREVFDFFRNFENFPLLGGMLHSVEDFDDGRSRWRVMGGETLVEWDVIVTKYVPPRVIGWESVAGAPVDSHGTLRFEEMDPTTTCVRASICYRPASPEAVRAFQRQLVRRPERRVRDALDRIDRAMDRAAEPHAHHRVSRYPLPDAPAGAASTRPATPRAATQP